MTPNRHFLRPALTSGQISIDLVGCGGNGAQILMGLASIDMALRATTNRFLHVNVIDDDIVSTANLGRQPFFPSDVGRHKAAALVERHNMAYGLTWTATIGRAPLCCTPRSHILISCVDTASARRTIHKALESRNIHATYWLDLGNRATDGQFLLGEPLVASGHQERLPTVIDHFPELLDDSIPESDAPSCSMAEALEKQSLFVNRAVAVNALSLLWELLGKGSIAYQGQFVDLASGRAVPIKLPAPTPAEDTVASKPKAPRPTRRRTTRQ